MTFKRKLTFDKYLPSGNNSTDSAFGANTYDSSKTSHKRLKHLVDVLVDLDSQTNNTDETRKYNSKSSRTRHQKLFDTNMYASSDVYECLSQSTGLFFQGHLVVEEI
jgi:hypothetical protein